LIGDDDVRHIGSISRNKKFLGCEEKSSPSISLAASKGEVLEGLHTPAAYVLKPRRSGSFFARNGKRFENVYPNQGSRATHQDLKVRNRNLSIFFGTCKVNLWTIDVPLVTGGPFL
jgi:hypothetical protein